MVPQMMIVDKTNCYRIYGTVLILILGCIVLVGMRLVNKFAVFFLGCVIGSVAAVIIGMLTNVGGNHDLKYDLRLCRIIISEFFCFSLEKLSFFL
jgi:hypothetical protein